MKKKQSCLVFMYFLHCLKRIFIKTETCSSKMMQIRLWLMDPNSTGLLVVGLPSLHRRYRWTTRDISNTSDSVDVFRVLGAATSDASSCSFFSVWYMKRPLRKWAPEIFDLALIFGLCSYVCVPSYKERKVSLPLSPPPPLCLCIYIYMDS
jgi:hypothetical protein